MRGAGAARRGAEVRLSSLERAWWREREPSGARALLLPLGLAEGLFRAAAGARSAALRAGLLTVHRAAVPVISVGNLAVGGAGKTPVAIAIAERLEARGRVVALLSRGYRASRTDARVVSDGRSVLLSAAEGGDEPVLVARRLPGVRVLCGPKRARLARLAVERLGADALVLDDGFQHRALARDLDVVVLDAPNPWGNGHLLPRGPNREPRSALARAQLVWLARADLAGPERLDALRALALATTGRPPVESRSAVLDVLDGALARRFGADALRGRRTLALCAIARPERFHETLRELGAEVRLARAFGDHHPFTSAELEEVLAAAARAGCDVVATTEKDAVRLPTLFASDPRVRVVRIGAELIAGEELLARLIDAALRAVPAAPRGAAR